MVKFPYFILLTISFKDIEIEKNILDGIQPKRDF